MYMTVWHALPHVTKHAGIKSNIYICASNMAGVLSLCCPLWYTSWFRILHWRQGLANRSKTLITVCVTECVLFVMATALPTFEPFDIHADGMIAQWWRKWIKRLENLFVAAAISDKKRQRALLLHYTGEEVSEIFDTLPDMGEDFETAKTKLNVYFDLKKNWDFEIYTFQQAKQSSGETMNLSLLIATFGSYMWIQWCR